MYYSPRRAVLSDVVAVPATATTSSAVISSDELRPFEGGSFGKALAVVQGLSDDIAAAAPNANFYVSYDEGETWVLAATQAIATGADTSELVSVASYAPRLRVDVDLNGATLTEGHGISVDVVFVEDDDNGAKTLFEDVVAVPATSSSETTTGDTLSVGDYIDEVIAVATLDSTNATNVTARLQHSFDGTNWFDLGDSATDISSANFVEFSVTDVIAPYVRLNVIAGATGLESGHGLSANVFARRQA